MNIRMNKARLLNHAGIISHTQSCWINPLHTWNKRIMISTTKYLSLNNNYVKTWKNIININTEHLRHVKQSGRDIFSISLLYLSHVKLTNITSLKNKSSQWWANRMAGKVSLVSWFDQKRSTYSQEQHTANLVK